MTTVAEQVLRKILAHTNSLSHCRAGKFAPLMDNCEPGEECFRIETAHVPLTAEEQEYVEQLAGSIQVEMLMQSIEEEGTTDAT